MAGNILFFTSHLGRKTITTQSSPLKIELGKKTVTAVGEFLNVPARKQSLLLTQIRRQEGHRLGFGSVQICQKPR